ncbi:MAG: hypothetical protein HQ513_02935 [Rhodospirillales bacterium]|nr:hypothetical protein [Rhodospirillales bacterium]
MSTQSGNKILGPYGFHDFLAFQANKQPVHIQAVEIPEKISLSFDEFENKITYNRILVNNFSMSRDTKPIAKERYSDGVFVDPAKIRGEFETGASMTFRAAHLFFPTVANIVGQFVDAWGCEAQGNLYVSPAGANATSPHFDPHELFIFQLMGVKAWNLFEGGYDFPESNDGFDVARHPIGAASSSVRLCEGDVLFLPRGTVHQPVAESTSMHLAVGLKGLSRSQLLREILNILSDVDVEFRRLAFCGQSDRLVAEELDRILSRVSEYLSDGKFRDKMLDKIRVQARGEPRVNKGWLSGALNDSIKRR